MGEITDNDQLLRKCFVVGIVMLFVEASCIPVLSSEVSQLQLHSETKEDFNGSQTTIRVDDEGDGDYRSITEAVNHSSAGDIIEVYSGTYYESNITLTQQGLTLKGIPYELGSGNDSGKPCIYGGEFSESNGWIIDSEPVSNMTITGFYFQDEGPYTNFIIRMGGAGAVVSENLIISTGSTGAIGIYFSSYAKIFNNTILNSSWAIVDLSQGNYNKIYRNVIHDCWRGIALQSLNTTISENTIYNCNIGINDLANSSQVIERNCIYNCEIGLRFWGDNFVVERNRISNCSQYGIQCIASNTIITYNLLEHNAMGIYASAPTQLFTIEKNNFINNSIHTIFFVIIASPGSLQYRENYWGKQYFLPKFIFGLITSGGDSEDLPGIPWLILPFIKMDLYPAQEPYDIPE